MVDNEKDITNIFKRALEHSKYRVDAYNSGQEALSKFRKGVYDLAILDFKMPNMDGFALYEKMHSIDPNLKVLFISGDYSHFNEQMLKHTELTAVHFLNKPTSLNALVERVKELLLAK